MKKKFRKQKKSAASKRTNSTKSYHIELSNKYLSADKKENEVTPLKFIDTDVLRIKHGD